MKVLAFDTATAACSAAVWQDGATLAVRRRDMARGQSEALLPMIRDVLAEAGVAVTDLDLLAVTVGPGSFTGIRIGIAAARGLALATGLRCVGITTLEAMAAAVGDDERSTADIVVAAIDSKRGDVFVQAFDRALHPLEAPSAANPDRAAARLPPGRLILAGDGAGPLVAALATLGRQANLSRSSGSADPAVVAALAAGRVATDVPSPSPLYLRPADTTPPRR